MENFLQAETRCGYYVSTEIKKLWSVEMDCLTQLINICEKHRLKYYAGGGTLLGAVRHKGFIPWDDDIDVFMLEDEYTKFCKIAAEEIKKPYFFQNYKTQSGFGPGMSRIRRSDTTGCTKFEFDSADENFHLGIFIDIFPLTYVAESSCGLLKQKLWVKFYKTAINGYERKRGLQRKNQFNIRSYFSKSVLSWTIVSLFLNHSELSEHYLKACSYPESSKVGLISFLGFQDKYIWPAAWFEETVMFPFEGIMISCPKEYDKILRHQYGNYLVYEKGTAIHSIAVINTEHPYPEIMKKVWSQEKQSQLHAVNSGHFE